MTRAVVVVIVLCGPYASESLAQDVEVTAYGHDETDGSDVGWNAKDYVAQWTCGDGRVRRASAAPEAGFGSEIVLECP